MIEFFTSPEAWLSLLTLTILEIVLGVDNIIFISIITSKLPKIQQLKGRRIGLFLALFTGVTGLETNAPTLEVANTAGNGYIRKAIAFDAATLGAGSTSNTSTVTFDPCAVANWGTITHIAVMDSVTYGAGNVLFFGAVTTAKTIEVGDTFQVSATNLSIALA